ncbi:MAG TPA: histidine kinase dimerization/phosphoacceptor domain -containing protein [Thermoanaerobaculia bacterium]|nr:histidine kinase dimerization/phosphoacceptor domain -containing protein [Thermoanaerobaculia bacterium]
MDAIHQLQSFVDAAPDAIVIVDAAGVIASVNALAGEMFGYSQEELIGSEIELLVPRAARSRHESERHVYARNPRTRMMGAGRSLYGRRRDGEEFPVQISLAPYVGRFVISIIRDVTAQRRAEELIQSSLREKEALLREIHHRVKNNLQVTSSLLRLQASMIDDERVKEMFAETQHRIRSMALVHEKLYQSTNLAQIDFGEYARALGDLLFRSFAVDPSQIELHIEGAPILLTIEVAVPCGLIVNEALSNALKHAFPLGRHGTITIRLAQTADYASLTIADDGVGLPGTLDLDTVESLGLQLVRGLVQQIDGTLELDRRAGTSMRITFSYDGVAPHG